MIRICFFTITLSLEAFVGSTQTLPAFSYTVESGLPSSELYDIVQDRKGYIWIASDRGVSRFDGYTFRNFTTEEGLLDNTVFNLYEDDLGRMWFFSFSNKLCYFYNDSIVPYTYNDVIEKEVGQRKFARSFSIDQAGTFTIGYINGGIIRISGNGQVEHLDKKVSSSAMKFMMFETGGHLFYGSAPPDQPSALQAHQNAFFVIGAGGTLQTQYTNQFSFTSFTGIRRKNGSFIFYTPGEVIEVDAHGIHAFPVSDQEIFRFYEDKDSSLWVALKNNGARRYAPNSGFASGKYESFFEKRNISCFLQDNENGFWVSTLEAGLLYLPALNYRSFRFGPDPGTNDVVGITFEGKDKVYIGGSDGLVYSLLKGKNGFSSPVKVQQVPPSVYNLFLDTTSDALWIGSSRETKIIRKDGPSVSFPGQAKRFFCKGPLDGKTWMASIYTVTSVDPFLKAPAEPEIKSDIRIEALYVDHKNNIWLGGLSGLYQIKDKQVVSVGDADPLLHSRIMEISELRDGKLVLATLGNGVVVMDGKKIFHISVREGLSSSIVNGLAVEGNAVWAVTNKGLNKITFAGDTFSMLKYTIHQGLPTNDIRRIYVHDGTVWLATKDGAVSFRSEVVPGNKIPPPVYISGIYFEERSFEWDPDSTLTLNYQEDALRVDFAGLSYRWRGTVPYRYRLIGLTDKWKYTTSTSVQFTSLDPGPYLFEVSACNEDGVWSAASANFSFVIRSPWWAWWSVRISVLAVLLAGAWGWFYYRIRRIKQKNDLMEQIFNYRQQALSTQMNPHFLFNSLNSVQNFLLKEDKQNGVKYLAKFAKLMRSILDNSRQEYVALSDELEALRLYLELENLRYRNKFTSSVKVSEHVDPSILVPPLLIQPFVENAIHHGLVNKEKAGVVTVNVEWDDSHNLVCTVEDDGIGREAAAEIKNKGKIIHRSAGSEITLQRLQLLCKKNERAFVFHMTDKKSPGGTPCGTIVTFALPFKMKEA
jgi:ligand-binding sensor domain-containing protein